MTRDLQLTNTRSSAKTNTQAKAKQIENECKNQNKERSERINRNEKWKNS